MPPDIERQTYLPEATIQEIFAEIARRYDQAVMGLVSEAGTGQEAFRLFHAGGIFAAVGIARAVQTELLEDVLGSGEIQNEEDTP